MRLNALVSTVICLLSGVVCSAQEPQNPIQNPGFEAIVGGQPEQWTLSGRADLDNAQFYAGAMGLRMNHVEQASSAAVQQVSCAQTEYVAAVWVKTEGVGGTGARLRVLGPAGQVVAETAPVTDTQAWHRLRVPFNPGNLARLSIELSLINSTGSAWFDDVTVLKANEFATLEGAADDGAERENIALGKPYELSPPPSYEHCTDADDVTQLTDGQYTVGYFWTQQSTVGWYLYSPQITIDLGAVQPIDGIMINCPGGGAAGVQFPLEVTYLVSDDNEVFHEVAALTPRGLKEDGRNWYTHKFLADDLNTRGRYVMIRLDKAGSTVFADEVEVYRGDHDPQQVVFHSQARSRLQMAFAQYQLTPDTYTRGFFPETPHIKWLAPLSGGPIKAILMAYSGDMREAVELAQRLDIDYVPVSHYSYYRPTALGSLMQEQISTALPHSDVMIVGGFRWEAMPSELIKAIKARVNEGMGLVCVTQTPQWFEPIRDMLTQSPLEGDQGILDPFAIDLIPDYRKPRASHFHLGTFGKGRVAWVNWQEFTRNGHSLVPGFRLEDIDDDAIGTTEYAYAAMGKLVAWAAGRDARRISAVEATREQVRIRLEPGEQAAALRVVVRDEYFVEKKELHADVPAAGGTFDFTPGQALNGLHPVDVWLLDEDDGIIDLAVASYSVEAPARIESVAFAAPVVAPGEPLRLSVTVAGAPAGAKLAAVLKDTYGRRLDRIREVPLEAAGVVDIELETQRALSLAGDLWLVVHTGATLSEAKAPEVLDTHLERVWFEQPEKDDYIFCAWYAWDSHPMAFHGLRMLREYGLDTYVSLPGTWRAQNAAYCDIRHGPENVERVNPQNTDDSLIRQPCLTDPEYRNKTAERIEKMAAEVRPFGVLEWSLGDESTLGGRDYCVSETCLAAFRTYLQGRYADIAALNESWETDFATWDDVAPMQLKEVEQRASIGPWLEHRRYMESLFAEYHDWCKGLIKKHVPDARVGISGTPRPNSYSGHDWWKLMQGPIEHLSGYGGVQRELQRSFMLPGTFYSTFLGYDYKDNQEQRGRYAPWDLLFHGANGINYYTLMSDTLNCPLVRPDMSLTDKAPWFFEEVKELKAGMGRLFMAGEYVQDGVAIHYSPASIHAATATGLYDVRDRLRNYNINLTNIGKILQQSHLQYDFIHEEQMAAGGLSKYRALILPWSSAISQREADAIRAFVEGGGVVIADSYCGVRDDHGHPRAMLDDLFGIAQPLEPPQLQAAELTVPLNPYSDWRGLLGSIRAIPVASGSPGVSLTGARALGEIGDTPALIVNEVGRGTAVFLNCSFSNYAEVWDAGVAGETLDETLSPETVTLPIRSLLAAILSGHGVQAPVEVTAEDGMETELEVSRFALGDGQLIGLVRSIGGDAVDWDDLLACDLKLPAPAHVYFARSGGNYLGKVDTISDRLPRGIARVYTVLPYRVTGLSVELPKTAAAGDVLTVGCHIETEGGEPGPHVFHVSVQEPGGEDAPERPEYACNIMAEKGAGSAEIPFAYSDTSGTWTVRVRDVTTGMQATNLVEVRAAE